MGRWDEMHGARCSSHFSLHSVLPVDGIQVALNRVYWTTNYGSCFVFDLTIAVIDRAGQSKAKLCHTAYRFPPLLKVTNITGDSTYQVSVNQPSLHQTTACIRSGAC